MIRLTSARSESVASPSTHGRSGSDDQADNAHRQLIGYIGLALPILLILIAVGRDGLERWRELTSISAYYYTGAVAAFVGMLVALSLFLFTYPGYSNKYHWADRMAAIIAAIAALGVAFFPTAAPASVSELSWWSPATGVIHHVFAVVLFSMFAVFALWLFRITSSEEHVPTDKRRRNGVYLGCGIVIVASMLWAAIAGLKGKPIFVAESVALVAFAVSWLVKGYAHRTILGTARVVTSALSGADGASQKPDEHKYS